MTHPSPHRNRYNTSKDWHDNESPLSFSQILRLILHHWYWFALSLVLFIALGKVIVRHRPLGRQSYYMQLSSRQPHELSEPTMPLDDPSIKTSPWTPEYIASLLNTTTAVIDAGERINFQVDYSVKTSFGRRDYYNQTPIIVHFDDLISTDKVYCIAELDDPIQPREVTMSRFAGVAQGSPIHKSDNVTIPVGDTRETPAGRITVTLDNRQQHYPYHIDQQYRKIAISYTPLNETRYIYETEMQISMKDADLPLSSVIRVNMISDRSERRCLELLKTMYIVTDSLAWMEYYSDLEGDSVSLSASRVPPVGVSPFKLVDEPRLWRETQPDLFIIAGMGLLGLLLPLLILYIYWSIRGVIYYISELPRLLYNRIMLDVERSTRQKHQLYPDLEELCASLTPCEGHSTALLTTPSELKAHHQLIDALRQALQQRGTAYAIWHLSLSGEGISSETGGNVYHTAITPGMLSSAPFRQQLERLQMQYPLLFIDAPALSVSTASYLLSESFSLQTFCCVYRGGSKLRDIKRIVQDLQIRQQLALSRWHTLWIK